MRTATLGPATSGSRHSRSGCAGIGNLYRPVTDEAALATVEAAWDAGIRTFDTAPHYGLGLSERRLGAALRGRPRDTYTTCIAVEQLRRPIPDALWDELHAEGLLAPGTPVPTGSPDAQETRCG